MNRKVISVFLIATLFAWSAGAQSLSIPSGTDITVRTNENIDSKTAKEGQTFAAVVDRAVVDEEGRILIPKAADARLVIRKISSGGALGSSELVLDLESVTVNGQRYRVSAAESVQKADKEGLGANRRTGTMVGGGAAVGTIIGAIAGGKKGAIIGAITGAGAGAAAQVLTKGKEVQVPAETTLTFRTDQPLQLEKAS